MTPTTPSTPPTQLVASPWHVLLRLRWPLGATIAVAFAVGQMVETLIFGNTYSQQRVIFDIIGWGLLGGVAVWSSLTWVSRQEQRYQAEVERALREQHELNHQLQRANSHLALLSDVNRQIANSATLDEILNAALILPQRLVQAHAAALLLHDPTGAIETRTDGASTAELARLRAQLGIAPPPVDAHRPAIRTLSDEAGGDNGACVLVPLHDSVTHVGWIELYVEHATPLLSDELALLETIASEIAEAIVSARRRSAEARAIYELERAIADERARIARDIHDGITQTLAFRRMRIDLWLDWLETDRDRLRIELIENKQILREQIRELRRAIFALRPIQFDELGFAGGLHRYIVEFAGQHSWKTQIDVSHVLPVLSPDVEAICFRVVQEALTNVAKHARASRVDVSIDQAEEGVQIVVRDDGAGFEPDHRAEAAGSHVGLRQMRERLQAIGGQLSILSQPGAGTEVRAWIPVATEHAKGNTHEHRSHPARR